MSGTQSELRLAQRIDLRETTQKLHEDLLASATDRDLTQEEKAQIAIYREKVELLDVEIKELADTVTANNEAIKRSKEIRMAGLEGSGAEEDGVIYRSFPEYARDLIITGTNGITGSTVSKGLAAMVSTHLSRADIEAAHARLELLKRTPADTKSADIAGLSPAQHIAQIFQVIDSSRPIVTTAQRADLVRGQLTYPLVNTHPVVAVQNTEKTEGGNTKLDISMETATASAYLGGGDISWQAVQWSSPNALDLWFRFAAADYALKTEQDAAQVLQHSAFSNNIGSPLGSTPSFADFMTAVGAGYAEVYANSGRIANTLYLAPDRFGYLLGLTSNAFTQFTNVSGNAVGPLNVVVSRGMDSGVMAVGDNNGLLVAETPGAPVDLQVVEPAIGGYEVGIIGAFEAVVVDDGSFSMITTAS